MWPSSSAIEAARLAACASSRVRSSASRADSAARIASKRAASASARAPSPRRARSAASGGRRRSRESSAASERAARASGPPCAATPASSTSRARKDPRLLGLGRPFRPPLAQILEPALRRREGLLRDQRGLGGPVLHPLLGLFELALQLGHALRQPGGGAARRLELRLELVLDVEIGDGVRDPRRLRGVLGGDADREDIGQRHAPDVQPIPQSVDGCLPAPEGGVLRARRRRRA